MTRRRHFLALGACAPVAFLASSVRAQEAPNAADIGFCQDMGVHHMQALVMCQRVLGRDTGGSVQAAAAEVLQNQSIEVGRMQAWLADWGASTVPPTLVMAWMHGGHGHAVQEMPGYATPAQLLELSTLEGSARGRRWLELMRAHHVGGVEMASRATELASSAKVVRLAAGQVRAQTYEIAQYDFLLANEYHAA